MKFYLYILSGFLLSLAWLIPYHYRPWATYSSEYLAFLALVVLMVATANKVQRIPKQSLGILLLAVVPLVQLAVGKIYYASVAILATLYVLGFWGATVVGYNLALRPAGKAKVFCYLSYLFLATGVLTALMAMIQWLGVERSVPWIMNSPARPYANFAQPNNMATFLMMSLLAALYLYEKQKLKIQWILLCVMPILIAVAMSQSRTAWVAMIAVFLYITYRQYRGVLKIKWWQSTAVFVGFLGLLIVLPELSQLLTQAGNLEVVKTRDVVARASGDMSRLAIWQQMIHAIALEPWFGHGFYQTSPAFVKISEFFQGPVWIRSSHNFIIDFLVWNGLVVGLPFLVYFTYVGYFLNRHAKSVEAVIGLLMIAVFVIHAMFEFPQHYAYFLLPVGFIWGVLLATHSRPLKLTIKPIVMKFLCFMSVVLLVWIHHDYNASVDRLNQAMRANKQGYLQLETSPVLLLTEFNHRAEIIQLNPYTEVTDAQLAEIEKLVQSYPTSYNLIKYARILAFNGYEDEARYQLMRLKWINKMNVNYDTLLEDAPQHVAS